MCGLFGGMSGTLNSSEIDHIRQLGAISYLRGDHSTGLAMVSHRKKKRSNEKMFNVAKGAVDPYYFLYHPATEKALSSLIRPCVLMGHARFATVGVINDENAHPYEFENIIGAHNGTISKFSIKGDDKTDSYRLYEKVNEHGIEKVVKEELTPDSAYALTWIDKKQNTLNMIRNLQRPLWIMYNQSKTTVYWASEEIFLEMVKSRSNWMFSDPELLPTNTLHTWELGSAYRVDKTILEPKPIVMPKLPLQDENLKRVFGYGSIRRDDHDDTPFKDLVDKIAENHKQDEEADKEEEKKTTIVMGPTKALLPPRTPINDRHSRILNHNPLGLRVDFPAGLNQTPYTLDSPRVLWGADVEVTDYPDTIKVHQAGVTYNKYLRYEQPYNKYLMSKGLYMNILSKGCSMCGYTPEIDEEIVWLNEDEFVLEAFRFDDFVLSAVDRQELKAGRWVYAGINVTHQINETVLKESK